MQRVQEGWKTETYEVPVYKERKVKVGTRTVYDRVPAYEWQKVQTGWRDNPAYQGENGASTSSGKDPGLNSVVPPEGSNGKNSSGGGNGSQSDYNDEMILFQNRQQRFLAQQAGQQRDQPTGTPPPPTATPYPYRAPSPEPCSTPYPTGQRAAGEYEPTVEVEGKWISRGLRFLKSGRNVLTARAVVFNALKSGQVSVSAPSLPIGTRRDFLSGYGFCGTKYNSSTITGITGKKLVSGALSKGTWITAAATSLAGNIIDYGFGKNKDKGIASQEFAVSTGVDTVLTVGTGVLAAGGVALVTAALGVTLPVWGAIAATVAAGLVIGGVLDAVGAGNFLKEKTNKAVDAVEEGVGHLVNNMKEGWDAWTGIPDNARVIGRVFRERVNDKIGTASENIQSNMVHLKETAENTIANTSNTFRNFVGSIFSGGN
jgi:hypothetical protein